MEESDTYLAMNDRSKNVSNTNRPRRMSDVTWAIHKFESAGLVRPSLRENRNLTKSSSHAQLNWNNFSYPSSSNNFWFQSDSFPGKFNKHCNRI